MKKGITILSGIIITIMVCVVCPTVAQAAEETDASGVTWEYEELASDSTKVNAKISGDIPGALRGQVTVPATLGGKTVAELAEYAFYNKEDLVNVTIPNTVTKISDYAFQYCSALKTVNYDAATVTEIGCGAFTSCSKMESFTLPTNASYTVIRGSTFSGCEKLSTIVIPSQIYKIEGSAFNGSGLQSIVLPNTIEAMEDSAFRSCEKLTSVTLPVNNSLTEIPASTFSYCKALKGITIPEGYDTIGESAFSGAGLVGICFPATIANIDSYAFYNCENLKLVQFTGAGCPTFNGEGHFKYSDDFLKIMTPVGQETVYQTQMKDADNTLGLPEGTAFTGQAAKVTLIPILSGNVTVTGTLYEGKPASTLTITGTFLNAYDNTTVAGTLSWETPTQTYTYGSATLRWIFTPAASYGAGAMTASGSYSAYVNKSESNTNKNNDTIINIKNNSNVVTSVKKPGKPTIKSIKKKGKKAIVMWKKMIYGATGYQIAVSTKKTKGYKVKATIKGSKKLKGTVKGFKKKKTYYIKVRSYVTVGSIRVYGSYSKVKKIKF